MPSISVTTIRIENILIGSQLLPLGYNEVTVSGSQALSKSIDIWDFDDEDDI